MVSWLNLLSILLSNAKTRLRSLRAMNLADPKVGGKSSDDVRETCRTVHSRGRHNLPISKTRQPMFQNLVTMRGREYEYIHTI